MNIVQMNFSTEGEFGRSMRVLQAGIDSTSELAKFLVG